MTVTTELRVIDLGVNGFLLTSVDFVDGQSRSYSEDDVLLSAPTYDALKRLIEDAAAALKRPALSDATDFPGQNRVDLSKMFGGDHGSAPMKARKAIP